MAKRGGKSKQENTFRVVADFAETVNSVFESITGKNIPAWLKEFRQRPKELPLSGEQIVSQQEPAMPLADAYAILGLPQTASLEEVKRNYKHLAVVFHPDKGGYKEAMVLLNNAYEQIKKEKAGVS